MSYEESATTFAITDTNYHKAVPSDYISPVIIAHDGDVAQATLGCDPDGNRDGYGAKWDDYKPPAVHGLGAIATSTTASA